MKLIENISKLIKSKTSISPKLGMPSTLVGVDGFDPNFPVGFREKSSIDNYKDKDEDRNDGIHSKFGEIEEIYFLNNDDIKDLIFNISGIISTNFGIANGNYEAIRISYDSLSLDLNVLMKIYSFTSGDRAIFVKNTHQKNKFLNILNSMNMPSVGVIDLISFE